MLLTGPEMRSSNMEKKIITCTGCRNACILTVETEDGEVVDVDGNGCMRGYAIAQRFLDHPSEIEE